MAKRFNNQQEINVFLEEPRLAILMYLSASGGAGPTPVGVPVWFDWDGSTVRMFAGRTSPKVKRLLDNPHISVLVTNKVGEPEAWVAFDGEAVISDFEPNDWTALLDRVAPRYWDLSDDAYAQEIEGWRAAPEAFVSIELQPAKIRSGA